MDCSVLSRSGCILMDVLDLSASSEGVLFDCLQDSKEMLGQEERRKVEESYEGRDAFN